MSAARAYGFLAVFVALLASASVGVYACVADDIALAAWSLVVSLPAAAVLAAAT